MQRDRIGTFADFIAINENDVAIKPRRRARGEAACIPLVCLTAWQARVERARAKKGQEGDHPLPSFDAAAGALASVEARRAKGEVVVRTQRT